MSVSFPFITPLQPTEPAYINMLYSDILGHIFSLTESNVAESFVSKKFYQASRDGSLCKYFFCQLHSMVEADLPDFEFLIDRKEGDSWFVINKKAIKYFIDLRKASGCVPPILLPKKMEDYFSISLNLILKNTYQEVVDKNFRIFCININTSGMDGLTAIRKGLKESKFKAFTLNLNERELTLLPPEICELTSLRVLNLRQNQLRDLPSCLSKLVNLTCLDLSRNPLKKIPSSIFKLSNLSTLILEENKGINPETLGNLTNLTTLHFKNNLLQNLPQTFSNLEKLTELNLGGNPIEDFPSCILKLSNLRTLSLGRNPSEMMVNEGKFPKSMNFPETFDRLTNLTCLNLAGNPINNPPDSFGSLANLTELNFSNTKIEVLPTWIFKLTNLRRLYLFETPLNKEYKKTKELSNRLHEGLPNLTYPKP